MAEVLRRVERRLERSELSDEPWDSAAFIREDREQRTARIIARIDARDEAKDEEGQRGE